MTRKSLADDICPVARTLDRIGDPWAVLILRDAGFGLTRFDEFQKSLGVASNILAKRLDALVEAGFLDRRLYSERPPRAEYPLTRKGRDFHPVLAALKAFGDRHYPKGVRPRGRDRSSSRAATPPHNRRPA